MTVYRPSAVKQRRSPSAEYVLIVTDLTHGRQVSKAPRRVNTRRSQTSERDRSYFDCNAAPSILVSAPESYNTYGGVSLIRARSSFFPLLRRLFILFLFHAFLKILFCHIISLAHVRAAAGVYFFPSPLLVRRCFRARFMVIRELTPFSRSYIPTRQPRPSPRRF